MTKPERRWQLLLMADDGRIVPFKHIQGIALTLVIALVLMGVVCAGLTWQLSKEKIRLRQTLDQLAAARQEAARYKSENEIATAELILAEARMEKAGLPVPERQPATARSEVAEKRAITPPAAKTAPENQIPEQQKPVKPVEQPAPRVLANAPSVMPDHSVKPENPVNHAAAGVDTAPEQPPPANTPQTIALGEMAVDHDPSNGRVKATFRVSNTGPRSLPVKGWCLVALKSDPADADTWVGLPSGALTDGKLDPKKGKNFRISRFIDMNMEAAVTSQPSSFTLATVYIFDDAGGIVLEKDYPIAMRPDPSASEASVGGDAEDLAVALNRFEVQFDSAANILRAKFQLSNTGPRSSPVTGRCVVLLKNEQMNPEAWMALPEESIIDGKPKRDSGHPFRISRFKDMVIEAAPTTDPTVLDLAVVYIFDLDGALLLEKTYPIRLVPSMQ